MRVLLWHERRDERGCSRALGGGMAHGRHGIALIAYNRASSGDFGWAARCCRDEPVADWDPLELLINCKQQTAADGCSTFHRPVAGTSQCSALTRSSWRRRIRACSGSCTQTSSPPVGNAAGWLWKAAQGLARELRGRTNCPKTSGADGQVAAWPAAAACVMQCGVRTALAGELVLHRPCCSAEGPALPHQGLPPPVAAASLLEKEYAHQQAAVVNAAYDVLKKPLRRAHYIVRLCLGAFSWDCGEAWRVVCWCHVCSVDAAAMPAGTRQRWPGGHHAACVAPSATIFISLPTPISPAMLSCNRIFRLLRASCPALRSSTTRASAPARA